MNTSNDEERKRLKYKVLFEFFMVEMWRNQLPLVLVVKEFELLCAQAWRNMQIGINVDITVTEKLNDV